MSEPSSTELSALVAHLTTATQRDLDGAELDAFNRHLADGGTDISGFDSLLGSRYIALGPSGTTMELTIDSRHLQPWEITHGGLYASLGESAGSLSGFIAAGASKPVVGVNNNTDFLRPSRAGMIIRSTAEAVHVGRSSQVWLVRHVDNGSGTLLARTTLRLAVLQGRP